ncbi:uncharacterized protein NFIA_002030 [Aspergillus fischeri NRRL 181]|uniref:Uncharacterized protein n=1 Tax=Neosartorya fischeri (strain ATCC 1020 / DSM 3700 / CBS 544.65 / FGSC A1164 / JCM 1740 / NRRL 181 / WB 181) TaxID=331117 RepID=A1DJG5_NEOFI|nr:uncharacterized protein NFIA_002030 [Aspergillus fischeri NRRL 181]EAW16854.1 hypothetical protein NFIA_002030 [Aspergillus fischeri NRRL 181]
MPDPVQEPVLQLWTESLDAVVDQAIRSVSDHRVNAFDLARINSFIDDAYRRPSHRPIFYHLQPSTNQRYRRIWKRLLCFVYRTAQPNQPIRLAHILTEAQADLLQQMLELGRPRTDPHSLFALLHSLRGSGPHSTLFDRAPLVKNALDHSNLSRHSTALAHPAPAEVAKSN